jgi:glycine/D-amino acid oxidase-like deaminating enzyme
MKLLIIGSGIVGLSLAEYFSRDSSNNVILNTSRENLLAGSLAAPANVSLKSQVIARQKHFNYKIQAQSLYSKWIQNLEQESSSIETQGIKLFRQGKSVEFFETEKLKEEQYMRVTKNASHDPKKITMLSRKIEYDDEIYVSGTDLLKLLKEILQKRENFRFDFTLLSKKNAPFFFANFETAFFCTGAWTFQLLESLGIKEGLIFKPRYSLGLSLSFHTKKSLLRDYVLIDIIKKESKKYTLSGREGQLCYLSSFSRKLFDLNNIDEFSQSLKEEASNALEYFQKEGIVDSISDISYLFGVRMRLNHEELSIQHICSQDINTRLYFCTGFHKSGFYYAPIIGEVVQNFLSKENNIELYNRVKT